MNTNEQKFTRAQQAVFTLLCTTAGGKLSQREIARQLGITPAGVAKALPAIEKAGLARIEKHQTMNLNLVSLNRTQHAMRLKRAENLRRVYETGLADALEERYPGATIILFGSYSKGEDTTTSDIDIAIIGAKEKSFDQKTFEKLTQRHMNIQFYPSLKTIEKELRENLCNGIVLAGGVEL